MSTPKIGNLSDITSCGTRVRGGSGEGPGGGVPWRVQEEGSCDCRRCVDEGTGRVYSRSRGCGENVSICQNRERMHNVWRRVEPRKKIRWGSCG